MSHRNQQRSWILDLVTGEEVCAERIWFRVILTAAETQRIRFSAVALNNRNDCPCDCNCDCACQPGEILGTGE